jgi:hypothetical protein
MTSGQMRDGETRSQCERLYPSRGIKSSSKIPEANGLSQSAASRRNRSGDCTLPRPASPGIGHGAQSGDSPMGRLALTRAGPLRGM